MFLKFVFMIPLLLCLSVAQAAENNQALTGSDLKEAIEMNNIYARHMYSSTCMERQKALYMPRTLSQPEVAARILEYKKSCDCLTDVLLKTFTPDDLIKYVTDMDGVFPPGVRTRPKLDPVIAKKYGQISAMNREIRLRQQCGFKQ
ncbi:MAG: hypothetical protein JNL76_02950 [Alphaproteobacteria bacterium]|nr:hypothetical protein [Alphaproteobacteria bacterium]